MDTAVLLRKYRSKLVDHWAKAIKEQPGSSYASRPLEELRISCGECLDAYAMLLETGDSGPLWAFIERVSHFRAALHFPPSDVTEAFMILLESVEIVLGPAVGQGEAFIRLMRDLRGCTRTAVKGFVNTYLIHLELAHSSLGSL
ncbi:MAG: hypothetical protein KY468_12045 [Armatimonadetes bacterium]|nr:hypothetical protein [Armatimonadota bacterium]